MITAIVPLRDGFESSCHSRLLQLLAMLNTPCDQAIRRVALAQYGAFSSRQVHEQGGSFAILQWDWFFKQKPKFIHANNA